MLAALQLAADGGVDGGAVALDHQGGGVGVFVRFAEDVNFKGLAVCGAVPEKGDCLVLPIVVQVRQLDGLGVGAGQRRGVLQPLFQNGLETGLQAVIFRRSLGQGIQFLAGFKAAAGHTGGQQQTKQQEYCFAHKFLPYAR